MKRPQIIEHGKETGLLNLKNLCFDRNICGCSGDRVDANQVGRGSKNLRRKGLKRF